MRSQNAAKAWGGAIARERDRYRRAPSLVAICGLAALVACTGSPAPRITTRLSSDAAPPTDAMVPQTGLPAPAASVPLPTDLTGLGAADILTLFGSPDFRRSEPPAELWQYRRADCILDIFLYKDARGYRVAHAEIRARRQIFAADNGCSTGPADFVSHGRQSRL